MSVGATAVAFNPVKYVKGATAAAPTTESYKYLAGYNRTTQQMELQFSARNRRGKFSPNNINPPRLATGGAFLWADEAQRFDLIT